MDDHIDIRAIRDELKMSQAAFAKAIGGVDQSTVSIWERKGVPKNELLRESLERRIATLREQVAA